MEQHLKRGGSHWISFTAPIPAMQSTRNQMRLLKTTTLEPLCRRGHKDNRERAARQTEDGAGSIWCERQQQTGEQQAAQEPTATPKMWHGCWRITSSARKGGRLVTVNHHIHHNAFYRFIPPQTNAIPAPSLTLIFDRLLIHGGCTGAACTWRAHARRVHFVTFSELNILQNHA